MIKLRQRVLTVTIGLITGTVAICGVSLYLVASRSLRKNLDNSILQLAQTEIASATDMGFVHVHELGPQTISVKGVPGYEKYVWIEDATGRKVANTSNIGVQTDIQGAAAASRKALSGETTFDDIVINGRPVRAVFYPFRDLKQEPVVGVVGVPSAAVTEVITLIGEAVWLAGFLCIL